MIKAIIIAEGECDGEIFEFESQELADAFAKGVGEGAGRYGCGGCVALTLRDLDDRYATAEDQETIRKFLGEAS